MMIMLTLFLTNIRCMKPIIFHIQRNSKDLTQNAFGVSLIEVCKNFSMHIVKGRNNEDAEGEIMCIANNGSSVVDYFIVYTDLFFNIAEFVVDDRSEYVHFPLHFSSDFRCNIGRSENDNEHNYVSNEKLYKHIWDEHKKTTFLTDFGNIFSGLKSRLLITLAVAILANH